MDDPQSSVLGDWLNTVSTLFAMKGNTNQVTGLCSILFSRNLVCSVATYDSGNFDLSTGRRLVGS